MRDPLPDDVRELITRCQGDDFSAWQGLIQWLLPQLRVIAWREHRKSVPTNPCAPPPDDLVQEALVSLYRNIKSITMPSGIVGWLTMVIRNRLRDAKRSKYSNEIPTSDFLYEISILASQDDPTILSVSVATAVGKLSGKHQQIVFCVYWLRLSVSSAAKLLGIREGTAKSRLWYAQKMLRTSLLQMGYH